MKSSFILVLVACGLAVALAHGDNDFKFSVDMNGAPDHVKTKALGDIDAKVDVNHQKVVGTIRLKAIAGVTMAHFHCGGVGVNGGVAAWLWPTDTKKMTMQPFSVGSDYWSVPFTITAKDVMACSTAGGVQIVKDFKSFANAIKNGLIYANVHTLKNPEGEIRGQTKAHH